MANEKVPQGFQWQYGGDDLEQRLLAPPDCFADHPEIVLGPEFKSTYSEVVEQSFANHLQDMAALDSIAPFEQRVTDPLASYWLYRKHVPARQAEYWAEIDRLAGQAGTIAPGKRFTVSACVALEHEALHIGHSLGQYLPQSVSSEDYEVLLLLNTRGRDPAIEQQTLQTIDQFECEHPEIDIRKSYVRLQPDELLSDVKKKATDIAVTRWAKAKAINQEQYFLVLNDADTGYLHPEYLEDYEQLFTADSTMNIAGHVNDMDHRAFEALGPDFTFGARVRQVAERQMDRNSGLLFPEGSDMSMRPQVYCGVGGFVPGRPYGVDYTFGKLLLHYRQWSHTNRLVRPTEVGIQTSARRPAYSHLNGIRSGFNTREDEEISRAMRVQAYPYITSGQPLREQIQAETGRILDHFASLGIPRTLPFIGGLFRHFGVEVDFVSNNYVVGDTDVFAKAYQRAFGRVA